MAKKGMRPEVKAQKLKNNKTSNTPIKCQHWNACESYADILHGPFDNRVKVCYHHFINPPQVVEQVKRDHKAIEVLMSMGLV